MGYVTIDQYQKGYLLRFAQMFDIIYCHFHMSFIEHSTLQNVCIWEAVMDITEESPKTQ